MAIQNRRGAYGNFDPTKMVAGEFAVVQDNDPNSTTGRSLYICFEPGVVKRVADYEDIQDMVAEVAEQYVEDFDEAVTALTTLVPEAETATAAAEAIVNNGNAGLGHGFAVCDTLADTAAKEISMTGFQLVKGAIVAIRFTYGVGSFNCTLNINETGAKQVYYKGSANSQARVGLNDTVIFVYDGSSYHVVSVERNEPLLIDCGTISSLPFTKSNTFINKYMICTSSVLGTPSAQTGDWTVTTADGSVTISADSGGISGSTTLYLILEHAVGGTFS